MWRMILATMVDGRPSPPTRSSGAAAAADRDGLAQQVGGRSTISVARRTSSLAGLGAKREVVASSKRRRDQVLPPVELSAEADRSPPGWGRTIRPPASRPAARPTGPGPGMSNPSSGGCRPPPSGTPAVHRGAPCSRRTPGRPDSLHDHASQVRVQADHREPVAAEPSGQPGVLTLATASASPTTVPGPRRLEIRLQPPPSPRRALLSDPFITALRRLRDGRMGRSAPTDPHHADHLVQRLSWPERQAHRPRYATFFR